VNHDESSLIEFGTAVRARRKLRGMTLRDLAERTGVSTSYLSSVERGVNPSTGRPPQISARFAERLRQVLGMGDVPVFASKKDEGRHSTAGHACEHVLLYRLDEGRGGLAGHVAELTSGAVSDWICIADPAAPEDVAAGPGFHGWTWSFGSDPYPDEFLDPTRIVTALEARVTDLDLDLAARGYGLIIADCSAVMRWVVNPDAEIDFEAPSGMRLPSMSASTTSRISRCSPRASMSWTRCCSSSSPTAGSPPCCLTEPLRRAPRPSGPS